MAMRVCHLIYDWHSSGSSSSRNSYAVEPTAGRTAYSLVRRANVVENAEVLFDCTIYSHNEPNGNNVALRLHGRRARGTGGGHRESPGGSPRAPGAGRAGVMRSRGFSDMCGNFSRGHARHEHKKTACVEDDYGHWLTTNAMHPPQTRNPHEKNTQRAPCGA